MSESKKIKTRECMYCEKFFNCNGREKDGYCINFKLNYKMQNEYKRYRESEGIK